MRAADPYTHCAQQAGAENMLQRHHCIVMTRGRAGYLLVVWIGLSLGCVVELVGPRQSRGSRKIVVHPSHCIPFVPLPPAGEDVLCRISTHRAIRNREDCQVRLDGFSNLNGCGLTAVLVGAEDSIAGIGRESVGLVRQAFHFTEFLIVAEDERLVLDNGPARGASELIAVERRFCGVEGIARVPSVVPQQFYNATMKQVMSRLVHDFS